MSQNKSYYSMRTGKNPNGNGFGLTTILKLFTSLYSRFDNQGYFQENFGMYCVDSDYTPGKLGYDIKDDILLSLRKDNLWPIGEFAKTYLEDDLFDVIEYLYDHVSAGVDGYNHEFSDCGWHYSSFDKDKGRTKFRREINKLLEAYREGFELSEAGEILSLPEQGYENLLKAKLPTNEPDNIEAKVTAAKYNFLRARATFDDRRNAIRDLADVLEFLQPKLKKVLTRKDEQDLFNIANNFGIRHHNKAQQTNYDRPIWYSWLFYYYLSTIHASLRLIEKENNDSKTM